MKPKSDFDEIFQKVYCQKVYIVTYTQAYRIFLKGIHTYIECKWLFNMKSYSVFSHLLGIIVCTQMSH